MNLRKALAAIFTAAIIPVFATAQTYDSNQNAKTVLPALPIAPFTLSTVCATPTTPNSCASTSFHIIPLTGGEDVSLQIDAINGGVVSFLTSNTNVTYYNASMSIGPSSTPGQITTANSTSTAGRFTMNGSNAGYLAIVMTTASTSAITVTPYMSQHGSAVSIHGSVPLNVQPAPSATFLVGATINGTVPTTINNTAGTNSLYVGTGGGILSSVCQASSTTCANVLNASGDGSSTGPAEETLGYQYNFNGTNWSRIYSPGALNSAYTNHINATTICDPTNSNCANVNSSGLLGIAQAYSASTGQAAIANSFVGVGGVNTSSQFSPLQLDASNHVILSPTNLPTPIARPTDGNGYLIISPTGLPTPEPLATDSSSRLITAPTGLGSDTAFPTSISTSGTVLGSFPAGAKGVEIDIPPGATVCEYIATSALGTAGAALAVAHCSGNSSSATTFLPLQFNLAASQNVYVTFVSGGTATTYTSGLPTFRWV